MSALGITFWGFSISPAIVESDSNPEYIQMPTLSATPTPPISELPGSSIVLNGLWCQLASPMTASAANGMKTMICRTTSTEAASWMPRMLM